MIKHLKIQDYTIIDELEVDFENGLNIITGETGAGKSLIIDAIDIVLGAKTSKDLIQQDKSRALIELEVELLPDLAEKIKQNLELELEDDFLLISKEITQTTSRARVNGILISQNDLLYIRSLILDIHSQHQAYTYMQPKTHMNLLDSLGTKEHNQKVQNYKALYKSYQSNLQKLNKLKESDCQNQQQADFLKFQIDEINSAEISDMDEFDNLLAKSHVLENSQELKAVSYSAYDAIYGENENITDALDKVKSYLDKVSNHDENLKEITKNIETILVNLKDAAHDLRNYSDNLEYDEEELAQMQNRLDILSKIKRKYGGELSEVLKTLNKLQEEYELIGNSEEIIANLEKEITSQSTLLLNMAKEISTERKTLANTLSELVTENIKQLEMPYAQLLVDIKETDLSSNGIDNVEFMIITNPTEQFKPLVKIASGGEISRIMLAIKTVFANSDDIMCVVFDEIDTGVSGKTSQAIANQLAQLSQTHQILCITHQPIIASSADVHLHVSKIQTSDKLEVCVEKLNNEQREKVIANMLSGEISQGSLKLAQDMLKIN